MEIIIRKANINDISSIHQLNKKCLPIYYSKFQILTMMFSNYHFISLAEIINNNEIIGYMVGKNTTASNFHILSIGVDDSYRSKGLGKKILDDLINRIIKTHTSITLYVHVENVKAINFYEKNGFFKQEKIVNYYDGSFKSNSLDAFKLQKNICQ
jgi:ribosomal protein S18 acetylase RimI-like enzyme